ncbi:eukaryotic translation initiation factor 3 subunit B isoform X3 [Helianthus annuus]|uniref:eukaryotic translation initiation factor 3 subunit B isoform X3 n=1 Tax=Helianthus annuus TaxID=4232 RepID=UPI0016530909|nr:eukaryotic translation initiation factor 3 subunit B isoform X3 [Helianthus annuus]XP_035845529.1 eukaryotic translation initiation factor 3 subunit B isoform X3 [Helianthus annuus]
MLLTISQLIDFSPGEKYLANCSSHEPSNPRDTHRVVLNIFDVRTGKIMKGFNERADEFAFGETGGFTGVSWPVFSYAKEKLSLESQIY